MERTVDIVIRFIKQIIDANFGKVASVATGGEPADIMIGAEIEKEDEIKVGIGISADFAGTFNVPVVMGLIKQATQDMKNPDVVSLAGVELWIEITQLAKAEFPSANDQNDSPAEEEIEVEVEENEEDEDE